MIKPPYFIQLPVVVKTAIKLLLGLRCMLTLTKKTTYPTLKIEVFLPIFLRCSHQNSDRLRDLVAEHLDHMHYLNDILALDNNLLNEVLIKHLLHHLFLPLYVRSLADGVPGDDSVNKD